MIARECPIDKKIIHFADAAGVYPKGCVSCEFLRSGRQGCWCSHAPIPRKEP